MTPEYKDVVHSWLAKARSDLSTARLLIRGAEPHLDTGTYHCQQAAEKALKGWLTSQQVEFRKTHDLLELLNQCMVIHPPYESCLGAAQFLLPFATQFRYPGELFVPPIEEVIEALESAYKIVGSISAELQSSHPGVFFDFPPL